MPNQSLQKDPVVFNLLAPEALLYPYPLYAQMQKSAPVYYSEANDFWLLTRYRDVEAWLRDPRLSADRSPLFSSYFRALDPSKLQNFHALFGNMIIEKDAPEHTPLRKTANHGFKPRDLERWRPVIQERTDRLLDAVQEQRSMDFSADLSKHLPAFVISELFGVPEAERPNMPRWSRETAALWGAPVASELEAVAHKADVSAAEFLKMINGVIAERRQNRGRDMISLLINAYEESGLDLAQLPSRCIEILNGAFLTTSDVIPMGIHMLLSHPDQWQLLKERHDDPAVVKSTVEEILRFDSPVQMLFRIAKQDLVIDGHEIRQGSVVALSLAAANHDPEKFDSPHRFDILRSPNDQIGFGRGIHFCIGAPLARIELEIVFSTVARRLPGLRLDPEHPYMPTRRNLVFKGLNSLRVLF